MQRFHFWISFLCAAILFPFPAANCNNLSLQPPMLSNPSGCNLHLPINDFSCDASHFFQIDVTNAPGTALGTDVFLKEVRLIIEHEWAADLDITLLSPNDVAVELSSDNGSGQDNYGNPFDCNQYTSFISNSLADACNATSITSAQAPFIGNYLPEAPFSLFNDGTAPNGIWTLQVCDDGKQHFGTLEFVELVFETATCLKPQNVIVEAVNSNSVQLSWTSGSLCDSTILEYGIAGSFIPGSGFSGSPTSFILLDSCPPVTITGLTAASDYEIFLREKCSNGFSINSCGTSFSTTCAPPPITEFEDFNAQTICPAICGVSCPINGIWSNSMIDDFDWLVNDKTNVTTAGTGPTDDSPGGGKYIYIESSQSLCRNGNEGILISNCMEVHADADSCDMSFDYLLYGVNVEELRFEYTEDGGLNWITLYSIEGDQGSFWKTKFLDLDILDGKTVQFRFVGVGGNGNRSDIALDNITFYGSQNIGIPPYTYYEDKDGDGYGGQDVFFSTCSPLVSTPGFVENNLDCDDLADFINPGMVEFPCDGFDLNCNGMIDEFIFDPPTGSDSIICNGVVIPFSVTPNFGGQIIWYNSPTGMDTVHIGPDFTPNPFPTNFTSSPITHTYFAEEILSDTCFSSPRAEVSITILPQADINTTDSPIICEGDIFDLSTIDVIDNNGANGIITYHDESQPNVTNQIDSLVYPNTGETFYIASTPIGGCTDVVAVDFIIKPAPFAHIEGQDSVCQNSSQTLIGIDNGNGVPPLIYSWNTGDSTQSIGVSNHPVLGSTDVYILQIDAANGCSDADTLTSTTIRNISSVQRIVSPVSFCDGDDGSIQLTPLDGTPPFQFIWPGGNFIGNELFLDNLSQGAFSFTITDSSPQQCPFVIPIMTVDGPGAVLTSSTVSPVNCNGGDDGCILLDVNGNNPIISWSNGTMGETNCNLSAGTYTVTISDGACENIIDFEVNEPQKMSMNATINQPSCSGMNNGSIYLNVFGGNPPYQFNWSTGQQTQGINNVSAGTFAVTITDSRNCILEIPAINMTEPELLSFDTTALIFPACFGNSDGKISVKPKGGTGPYDVDWGTGAMGTTINNLASGTYEISIEDANGCVLIEDIFLGQPTPLQLNIDNVVPPLCKGQLNGFINVTPSGGTPGYTYNWSNNSNSQNQTLLPEGTYQVTITDMNGCTLASNPFVLIGAEVMSLSASIIQPPCIGPDIGSISVSIFNGGNGPFTFDWSIDESGTTIDGLAPGFYSVTATDADKCQVDTTLEIFAPQLISVNIEPISPACAGNANGQIFLNASGGMQPHTYQWSDSQDTTSSRFGLVSGNYFATITDANGCQLSTGTIPLANPPALEIELLTLDNPTCHGDSTGIIEVAATGGTGQLNYSWSSGDSIAHLNALGQGIFTLTVLDEKGCSEQETYKINWPPPLIPDEDRFITGCNNLDSVCVEVTGGTAPYNFIWSNGYISSCLSNVATGDYTVTISDAAGCTQELMSIKVPEDVESIFLQKLPSTDTVCFGETNGSLSIQVDGGSFPMQYIWNSGQTGITNDSILNISNLPPGNYQLTITDNLGCTSASPAYNIIGGNNIFSNIPFSENVKCKGGQDGEINLAVSGGFSPYSIVWLNESGDTISYDYDITNLEAGIYTAFIKDNAGCEDQISKIILEPAFHLGIDSIISRPTTCFGDEDGSIEIFPVGGTMPYFYSWSNGSHNEDLYFLPIGQYSLEMEDANGCSFDTIVNVFGPNAPFQVSDLEILPPLCNGESTGSINIEISGETPPYYFDWGISNNEDLYLIPADEYFLTVFDSTYNCRFDTSIVVPDPPILTAIASSTPSDVGIGTGTATVTGLGGTPPYHYQWIDIDTTQMIGNLSPGWYAYIVTDANGCEFTGGVQVDLSVSSFEPFNLDQFSLYPNPTSGKSIVDISFSSPIDFELKIFNQIGIGIYTQNFQVVTDESITIDLSDYPSGIFLISIQSSGKMILTEKVVKF